MVQRTMSINEIRGLTLRLLLDMALVASQAGATVEGDARAATAEEYAESPDVPEMPFTATIEGHFNGKVLTISVDNLAHFGQFRIDGD